MKKLVLNAIVLALSVSSFAQVGVGTTTPNTSAMLDVESTSLGFLPPRMTEVQMNEIVNPAAGLIVYCNDCKPKGLYFSTGLIFQSTFSGIPSNPIKDLNYGDGVHDFVYVPIISETGKTWLNNNLGAAYANVNSPYYNPIQQAISYNDFKAYGSLYQWGRRSDKHELINWTSATSGTPVNPTTTTTHANNVPTHGKFIVNIVSPYDWRTTPNDALWQGVNGANNPCPVGYRIPTMPELIAEAILWEDINSVYAFNSLLKLSTSAIRIANSGDFIANGGLLVNYWSSSVNGDKIRSLYYTTSVGIIHQFERGLGCTVRCIKN